MYQPAHAKFVENDLERLCSLIVAYPFGTLLTQVDTQIEADHIPFLLSEGEPRVLKAHVPRANTVWQRIAEQPAFIVFKGPDAYVSPSWYASKQEHGKVVPTWNYAAVHVRGTGKSIEDRAWLRAHLEELTDTHEKSLEHPWKVSDAPAEYLDKMLGAIVGIEIQITSIEGKFKLSQNRSKEDREGVEKEMALRNPALAKLAVRVR